MTVRDGPRPWPVTTFAAILVATASWNLGVDLQRALAESVEATRIAMVSRASAQFLIPVIPAAVIWLFASRVAKWFITITSIGFAAFKLALAHKTGLWDAVFAIRFVIGLSMNALVLLLFVPSARRWFAGRHPTDATVFE